MINPFKIGDIKVFEHKVDAEDFASFESGVVHKVYSTFALTRDAEWAGRLFVLEMKEADEEGIGTFVKVEHKAPAFEGELVEIRSVMTELSGNNIITDFEAKVGDRIVAVGTTGQKILKKEKVKDIFDRHKNGE